MTALADPAETPGFLAPVRQALVQPIFLAGAPRSYAILNGTLAMITAFAGAWAAGLALAAVGHAAGVFLAQRDAAAVDVLMRAMRIPGRFDP